MNITTSEQAADRACAKLSKRCRRITGQKIPVVEQPRRPGDPPRLIAASAKIKRELGWEPRFQSIDSIVESAWKWYQKFPNGYGD